MGKTLAICFDLAWVKDYSFSKGKRLHRAMSESLIKPKVRQIFLDKMWQ